MCALFISLRFIAFSKAGGVFGNLYYFDPGYSMLGRDLVSGRILRPSARGFPQRPPLTALMVAVSFCNAVRRFLLAGRALHNLHFT
jgi:hypothetical protein